MQYLMRKFNPVNIGISILIRGNNGVKYCSDFNGGQCALKYHDCWYCVCQSCKLDIVFMVDQTEDSEPTCSESKVLQFGIMNDILGVTGFDYPGAKSQIDFVVNFIESIPDGIFGTDSVRIAAATYGQQEEADLVFSFEQLSKHQMKCLLYNDPTCA